MSAKERILTIRLLDKLSRHPLYAMALGIESAQGRGNLEDFERSEAAESSRKP